MIFLEMLPAVRNTVTSNAPHIKNRGEEYFWCSRKAVKGVNIHVSQLNPQQLTQYKKKFICFVYLNPINEKNAKK